ncbi:hypothetical protein [Streptomyces sp. STR69]|uniref:hypothetical protein n=1 Tax=Streptomyces sp. STR69 TaxID=1796942 RepID=UPI0021C6572B|nr:hypothetical protein [Streptomyces sp. STR69]
MTRAAQAPPEIRTARPSRGTGPAGRGPTDGADLLPLPHPHGTAAAAGGIR